MEKYLFPTGAIRAVEKKLFDANDMERMIDAPDAGQSFKIFNELSYADELLDVDEPEKFREVLAHDLSQTRDFMVAVCPDRILNEISFAFYDFHNLKAVFKAALAGKETAENLSALSTLPADRLAEAVLKKSGVDVLPDEWPALVKEAAAYFEKRREPRAIDGYFDKKYFAFILEKARVLNDEFLTGLVKARIDAANVKIVIRSKMLGRAREEAGGDLIAGGNLREDALLRNYDNDLGAIVKDAEKAFGTARIIEELNDFLEHREMWRLEKALDDHIIGLIREAKMKPESPGVIAAYFLAKKNAVKNIRLVMTGKLNRIEPREIKERVRELY